MPLSARRAASGTERMALNFLMTTYIAACRRNGARARDLERRRGRLPARGFIREAPPVNGGVGQVLLVAGRARGDCDTAAAAGMTPEAQFKAAIKLLKPASDQRAFCEQ